MEQISQSFATLVERHGVGAYFGITGLIIFWIIGFVSVWLAIGMFIYSLFSKNWAVWRKWKYVGYLALLGVGFLLLGIIIRVITGVFAG